MQESVRVSAARNKSRIISTINCMPRDDAYMVTITGRDAQERKSYEIMSEHLRELQMVIESAGGQICGAVTINNSGTSYHIHAVCTDLPRNILLNILPNGCKSLHDRGLYSFSASMQAYLGIGNNRIQRINNTPEDMHKVACYIAGHMHRTREHLKNVGKNYARPVRMSRGMDRSQRRVFKRENQNVYVYFNGSKEAAIVMPATLLFDFPMTVSNVERWTSSGGREMVCIRCSREDASIAVTLMVDTVYVPIVRKVQRIVQGVVTEAWETMRAWLPLWDDALCCNLIPYADARTQSVTLSSTCDIR